MTSNNYVGNASTIIKLVGMTIAGWVISILASHGLNLGVDVSALGEVIGAFVGLAFGYMDAKYPNTFSWLGNAETDTTNFEEDCEEDV